MQRKRLEVTLTLFGPILTHGSAAGKLGIDAPVATLSDGRCYLPFSLIKGRVRQSWDELGFEDGDSWFGSRRGNWIAERGRFRFSDFVVVRDGDGSSATPVSRRHRIRIDETTGAADDGALQVIESPFAPGERVSFKGEIRFFAGEEADVASRLERAFRWTSNFGAGRTIGFGRVADVAIKWLAEPSEETQVDASRTLYEYSIALKDPFCFARKRIAENLFESDPVIAGSVVRGVAATTLNEVLGRKGRDVIDADATADPTWSALAKHFNAISISHALPSLAVRPVVPPISIVRSAKEEFHDVALREGPGLVAGEAPEFFIDWKHGADKTLRTKFQWPDLESHKEIRVRTAIDREQRRAADKQLFSYELIRPDDLVWRGTVDFSDITNDQERAAAIEQFQRLFDLEPAAWGKTKARGRLSMTPHPGMRDSRLQDVPWVVTLQTPALLNDATQLNESAGASSLFAQYARAWSEMSGASVRLVRFFAHQSLAGGYLNHRFRAGKRYAPFFLTNPGSVFVVEPIPEKEQQARDFMKTIAKNRLPIPSSVEARYTGDWRSNPFLSVDGFGEVVVNLECHRTDIPDFQLIERWQQQWQPPDPGEQSVPETLEVAPRSEETKSGTPQPRRFQYRWRIEASLETKTELHIGSGDIAPDRLKRIDQAGDEQVIGVASVAVDATGRAYLPASGLKGALRAALLERLPSERKTIEQLFGIGGDSNSSFGGRAEFHDAFAVPAPAQVANVPYWKHARLTGVTASAAIDRRTRTAEDEKLFHREYVPPGVSFAIEIMGDDLSESDAALIVFGLQAVQGEMPVTLGAETREGWGRFSYSGLTVKRVAVDDWIRDPSSWVDCTTTIESVACSFSAAARDVLRIAIPIEFDGPFLINEPSRTKQSDAPESEELPNHAHRIGVDGKVVLPVSSVRGALRSRAERIVRSLGGVACAVTDSKSACKAVDSAKGSADLCVVCQLFGAAGWATPLGFETFRLMNDPKSFHQDLVGIDRFTGGVSGSAKFDVSAVWKPKFQSEMMIDLSRWRVAELQDNVRDRVLGLLLLTLRDLADGDITLGFGASKGYGACSAKIEWPSNATDLVRAFHEYLGVAPLDRERDGEPSPRTATLAAKAAPRSAVTEVGDEFFNPYHFAPVSATKGPQVLEVENFRTAPHLTHAIDANGTHSGRIICSLTTETPLVIGDKQERLTKSSLAEVKPFKDPDSGQPAIPATSLRGMIGSLAEAASNSVLRVLTDAPLSYRCQAEDNLTAIGMIAADGKLLPLTMPSLRNSVLDPEWRSIFPRATLPVFLDGYRVSGATNALAYDDASFLGTRKPFSYSADRREIWYLDMNGVTTAIDPVSGTVTCEVASGAQCKRHAIEQKDGDYKVEWLLGLYSEKGPIDQAAYQQLDDEAKKRYTPGILRVLGIDGRQKAIPRQKKHEIFIPFSGEGKAAGLLDAADAIAEFERIAAQRTNADHDHATPFELKGATRNTSGKPEIRLRPGDLVFFKPAEGSRSVERLSISSIWRRSVDGDVYAFFRGVSPELLPFHPERKTISVAEQVFGFVGSGKPSTALASRVRFSMGTLAHAPNGVALMEPVPLKILSSPKPPSPSLYFRPKTGRGWVSKRKLTVQDHIPQGRKMYLHHLDAWKETPWVTAHPESDKGQKNQVTPIVRGAQFGFHVDFDNLTPLELGMLCYSLRPSDEFLHKLGMGKSLGLGSVRIDPAILLLRDTNRYRVAWSDRQQLYGRAETLSAEPVAGWSEVYDQERRLAASLAGPDVTFAALRADFRATMMSKHAELIASIETIGDPNKWTRPIHTPQQAGLDKEAQTFKWFVENDRAKVEHQYLSPLGTDAPKALHRTFKPVAAPARLRESNRSTPGSRPPQGKRPADVPPMASESRPPAGETWEKPSIGYEAAERLIIAKRADGMTAKRQAEEDDPIVVRIRAGEQVKSIRVRPAPDKRFGIIVKIEFA